MVAAGLVSGQVSMQGAPLAPAAGGYSAPLGKNPGVTGKKSVFGHIFSADREEYETFRLIGYICQAEYSEVQRAISDKLGAKDVTIQPKFFVPDWKSKSRMIVNAAETLLFIVPAFLAFLHDCKKFRKDIGETVAAERHKDSAHVSMLEIMASDNPLAQSAMNRFKSLYAMRFIQPLTFLWGLKLGVVTTVFQIVGERAAHFEKNSYDNLHTLTKEISNNQWNVRSQHEFVARLLDVIQKNRIEHNALPLQSQDIEKYMPLLQNVADRMMEKKWGFAEAVHLLGQVIKEPAEIEKVVKIYEDVEAYGLAGIAQRKQAASTGERGAKTTEHGATAQPEISKKVRDIIAHGPHQPNLAPGAIAQSAVGHAL